MTDPSYGGNLTHLADNRWQLVIHVNFDDEAITPIEIGKVDKVGYKIYRWPNTSPGDLESPDGRMVLVPNANASLQDTFILFADGYKGWPNSTMEIVQEHFIQVGPKNPAGTPNALDGFSLKFKFDATKYDTDKLELCYTAEPATGNQSVEPPIREESAGVLVTNEVMKSGYYALMVKSS